MTFKWIGAILIIVGCGSVGFSIANAHRRAVSALQELITAMEFMTCELRFRMTPLPELCELASHQVKGSVRTVLCDLSKALRDQSSADAAEAMEEIVKSDSSLPLSAKENLLRLGQTLGRFDLQGQLSGLASVAELARRDLTGLEVDKDVRLRSYQTLGICAGIALVILFI